MSKTWDSGIDFSTVSTKTITVPVYGDAHPYTKKSGNASFTSYFLPAKSLLKPPILRVSQKQSSDLYSGTTLSSEAKLPDSAKRHFEIEVIDNSILQCSEDDCLIKIAPFRGGFWIDHPLYDLGVDKDHMNLYINMLIGTTLNSVPTYTTTIGDGEYTLFDFTSLMRGVTDIQSANNE
jgi:hypothetical protein